MESNSYLGSSKQRRDLLKNETDQLGKELPFDYGKVSQLRILKAACNYLKKEKHFASLRNIYDQSNHFNELISSNETLKNEAIPGFIICFTKTGELIHVSDTSYEHLGLRSLDILFTYDNVQDMAHEQDKHNFKELETNFEEYKNGKKFSFYSLWFVSKIKRNERSLTEYKLIKMSGHYDTNTNLFIATCSQILSVSNREILTSISADCFTSVHDSELNFHEISFDIERLLGYDLNEDCFQDKSLYQIISPESLPIIKERHLQVLNEKNTKGYLDPVKILHKNGHYVDCLMNLYCDLKDQIICKYQIIDSQSMKEYKEFVVNFKRDWSAYKLQENPTTVKTSFEQTDLSATKQENDCANFISIEDTYINTSFQTSDSLKRQIDFIDSDEQDSFDDSFNSLNSNKRLKTDDSFIKSEALEYSIQIDSGTINNNSEEMAYFQGQNELSCFDLNEIIEINNIKESIEQEIYKLASEESIKTNKTLEYTNCSTELLNQHYMNQNLYENNYYHNQRDYFSHQQEDEQIYQSLIEDNDLFQSLQAF